MERNLSDQPQLGTDALAIRSALQFRPEHVRREVEAGRWTSDTVASWLKRWARETPQAVAVTTPGQVPLTFAAALDRAERLAAALATLGVRRGDVVTVQLPSTAEFVIIYYAVACLGGVLSTLHMPYGAGEAEPILRHSRACVVFCGAASDKSDPPTLFTALARGLPSLRHVISVGPPRPGVLSFETLIVATAQSPLPLPVATDAAVMCYTSGTSAAPKAVPHSSQSLLANPRQCLPVFDLKAGDRVLSAAPLTHAFGLFVANAALMAGATFAPLPVFTPMALATSLENDRPTHAFVAPPHVAALLKAGLLEGRNLRGLRLVVVSGSYCAPELKNTLEEKLAGGRVIELWGMTETFAVLLGDPHQPARERHEWIGRPTTGSEARVVDLEGSPVLANVEGELHVRGCSVFAGYFDNASANEGLFSEDDWLRTGDLAVMSATGQVRITGRTKDLINRGGVKINPSDVEALIDRHESVVQSAIIPMPDPILGERACCCVVLKPGMTLSLDELRAWLERQGVAKLKWPERLLPIAEMPVTPTRKVIKSALARLLREQHTGTAPV